MKRQCRTAPQHRRDWRRLWLRCRCGFRWRCPDSIELVPRPYQPEVPPLARATYRAAVRASAPVLVAPDDPPPPARPRSTNQRTAGHLAGRAERLTPNHADQVRHSERVRA